MSRSYFMASAVFALVLFSPAAHATKKIDSKTERHFDLDKSGSLDRYERQLLKTHEHFAYPLVTKKEQRVYDFNNDRMLEPFEEAQYRRDKESGKIKNIPIFR